MELRATKYDPNLRSIVGNYENKDWTSYSDIGRVFNGQSLTLERYLKTENDYINAIQNVLNYLKITSLKISNLEKHNSIDDFQERDKLELFECYSQLNENYEVFKNDLNVFVKLVLREYCWYELTSLDRSFSVKFGYDYYMYFIFQNDVNSAEIIKQIEDCSLFVEL
jgi:hypothetical protein